MGEVISDTSPLQYLHQLRLLDLLPALFGRVIDPESVVAELAEGRELAVDLPDIETLGWVEVRAVSLPAHLRLVRDLGPGEREVLALALERPR